MHEKKEKEIMILNIEERGWGLKEVNILKKEKANRE